MESINFELSRPFKYSNNSGGEIECNFIELREPMGKVSHTCCAIEGLIQTGILGMSGILDEATIAEAKEAALEAKAKDVESEAKSDPEAILAMMAGGGVDMSKVVLHFRELFKGVAFMGGEKLITAGRMDDMSHKDFRKMMGVYAANFVLN